MSKIVHVLVEKIQTEGMQTRAAIDPAIVREYAEAVTTGKAIMPPIIVFKDAGGVYWLADGFHRFGAAKQTGQKKIAADVHDGSRVDALKYALGANALHGLRRTNLDKAHAVKMAYEHRKELGLPEVPSANSIAELVGVHHAFVTTQLVTVTSWSTATARTGADGKTRELPPIPTRPKPAAQALAVPPVPIRSQLATIPPPPVRPAAPATPPPPPPPPTRRADPAFDGDQGRRAAGPVDCRGKHIPEDLLPIWNRRQEIQDLATAISRARTELRKAQEGEDPLWGEINFSSVLASLDRAYTEVSSAQPWCVCPMCQGIGCRACKERGVLSEFRFNAVVPKELKK